MTKDEAKAEALRQWRALPASERTTFMQARVVAAGLSEQLQFRTMADKRKLIEAWLVRDLDAEIPTPRQQRADRKATGGGEKAGGDRQVSAAPGRSPR